jgi:hypothetical protein
MTKNCTNLLPRSCLIKSAIASRLRRWAPVWAVALIAAVSLGAWMHSGANAEYERSVAARSRTVPVSQLRQEGERLRAEAAQQRQLAHDIARRLDDGRALAVIGLVGKQVAAQEGELYVTSVSFEEKSGEPRSRSSGAAHRLLLTGSAHSKSAIARLAESLRSTRAFAKVDHTSGGSSSGGTSPFSIICEY